MVKKIYELSSWDIAIHWDEKLTFICLDWIYAHWENEEWKLVIWNAYKYKFENNIYYPINK